MLPGAYETQGFLQDMSKKKVSYGFLGIERGAGPKIGHGYGDKVGLFCQYNVRVSCLCIGTGHGADQVQCGGLQWRCTGEGLQVGDTLILRSQ